MPLHPQAQAVCDLTNATRVTVAPEERVQTTREGWGLYLAMMGGEPQPVHAVLEDLESICEEERQLSRQRKIYHLLHGWLLVHVPASIALLVLGGIHAIVALRY